MRSMFAMVTYQGTAAAETAICSQCVDRGTDHSYPNPPADVDKKLGFVNCTENTELQCRWCGYRVSRED